MKNTGKDNPTGYLWVHGKGGNRRRGGGVGGGWGVGVETETETWDSKRGRALIGKCRLRLHAVTTTGPQQPREDSNHGTAKESSRFIIISSACN